MWGSVWLCARSECDGICVLESRCLPDGADSREGLSRDLCATPRDATHRVVDRGRGRLANHRAPSKTKFEEFVVWGPPLAWSRGRNPHVRGDAVCSPPRKRRFPSPGVSRRAPQRSQRDPRRFVEKCNEMGRISSKFKLVGRRRRRARGVVWVLGSLWEHTRGECDVVCALEKRNYR